MRILLTNDDGIVAPGLAAMHRQLTALGDVDVVAPDSAQSAAAHAITINAPLSGGRLPGDAGSWGWRVSGRLAE
ncbi:MAG: hypothetical protein GY778_10145 [bacterium]|nr:hypothetical protein [bacterium]